MTGGTGFIGSYVVEQLLSEGHELSLLARNPAKVEGFVGRPGIRFVKGELGDRSAVRAALDGANACIHIARANTPSGPGSVSADTLVAAELFDAAMSVGVSRIIYTSSIAVFDDRGEDSFTDDGAQRPTTIYGATKAAAEAYLLGMSVGGSTGVASIRPGYTFGDPVTIGASTQAMRDFRDFAHAAVVGQPLEVEKNTGLQFIWAGDLAQIYSAALASPLTRQFYTSLSTDFLTWESIARWTVDIANSHSEILVSDTGRPERTPPWSVTAIERDFGLTFRAERKLREHLAYWVALEQSHR